MDNYYRCRLCLEETGRNINIFTDEEFSDMIELLTGIKVYPEDGLPPNACHQCQKEVKSAMLTRYQIINSHKILIDELKTITDTSDDYSKIINFNTNADNNLMPQINNIGCEKKDISIEHEFHSSSSEGLEMEVKDENSYISNDMDDNVDSETSIRKKFLRKDNSDNFTENTNKTDKHKLDNLIMKLRCTRTNPNKDIKFKRKRNQKEKSKQNLILFKKKSSNEAHCIKIDYDIKPEHIEFLKTVGKKDRVACPICQREMYGMNLKNHLITHNFDPVICDTCGKTSKNAQALQDHINYYHKTTPDRFICDKCGKGYRVRFMLQRHEKKEHGNGEKDFECTICGKKFFEKLQLKNHINITHNKIKPFKCEHCGKDFGRRTQFVTHQLVHTKENRYHCQVCGKGFKIKQTMQTHLKGVHGIKEEKTIFCKICQKGFSSPQGLRAHVNSRVHGLEKCEHCSEFITLEYKATHLKEIHGIKMESPFS